MGMKQKMADSKKLKIFKTANFQKNFKKISGIDVMGIDVA